jgi:hypothetical protein
MRPPVILVEYGSTDKALSRSIRGDANHRSLMNTGSQIATAATLKIAPLGASSGCWRAFFYKLPAHSSPTAQQASALIRAQTVDVRDGLNQNLISGLIPNFDARY